MTIEDLQFCLLFIWMDHAKDSSTFNTRSLRKMAFWAIIAAIAGTVTLAVQIATGNSGALLLWALWPFVAILVVWSVATVGAFVFMMILWFWITVVGEREQS